MKSYLTVLIDKGRVYSYKDFWSSNKLETKEEIDFFLEDVKKKTKSKNVLIINKINLK